LTETYAVRSSPDAKPSPAPTNDDMDRDVEAGGDPSQRKVKRQRSCSCESDLTAKRRLQQNSEARHENGASDMSLGDEEEEEEEEEAEEEEEEDDDDDDDDDDDEEREILQLIAAHNAGKLEAGGVRPENVVQPAAACHKPNNGRGALPRVRSSGRVGLAPRDGNLRRQAQARSTTASASKARSSRSRCRRADSDENDKQHESEMAALIAAHNQKFKPKCDYAPPQHSVRDVRAWETETGNRWYDLSPGARNAANAEISRMKRSVV
jgi:hypothetical protein